MALSIGQLIGERYRLIRRIAVGGMGEVWEASDTRLARRVAIKVLKAELSGTAEFLQRFRIEARTTASLNHPGIAAVHDYGETAAVPDGPADTAYLVMELVEGEPLAAMIARRRRVSPERTLAILEQAGHALQAAHERGLVHRDVKPGNILITATGAVKLTDFGIAKAVDAAPVTRSGMVMGTAHYIAPEQAGGQEAGPASDVYSLGVVGYECLTGHRPFRSDSAVAVAMMHIRDTPPPLPADIPYGTRALIEATLVKDPRNRYGTGGEFAAAVAAVRQGLPLPRPGSAVLQVPPMGGAAVLGVQPQVASDDSPTGPQPRLAGRQHTALAVGPPTPNPPGSGQPVPQRAGQPPVPNNRPGQHRDPRLVPWLVVGLLIVTIMAIGGWVLVSVLDRGGGQQPSSPAAPQEQEPAPTSTDLEPTSTTVSPTVTIDVEDYREQSAEDVADELTENGLRPQVVTVDGLNPDDPDNCLVTDVSPSGAVATGSSVTVTCRQEAG